jgi:exonuclease SbcC
VEGGAAEARQVELDRDIRALEAELAGLQSAAAAHASAQATFDHCSFTIRTTASERETARAALERVDHDAAGERQQLVRAHTIAIEALDRKAADTRARDAERERIGSELAKHLAELDERIANNRTILAEATEIRAAARDFDRYEAEATEARTAERAAIADVQHAQARAQAVRARLTDLATNEAALTRATQAAGLLTTVPFGDDCAPCKFMTTAAAAKAEIPALEERCAERGAIERDQADATAAVETAERAVTELHERIVSIERLREGLRKKAARLPNLEQAEQRIADLERQKQDAQAAAASQGEHADAREAARQTELVEAKALREREHVEQRAALDRRTADRRTELKARIETLADRETALTFERDALADELAATKDASERAAAQTALQTLRRNEWTDVVTTVARVEMARAELERRRDALRAKRRELAGVDAEVARLTEDLIEWQLLGQALGRDGLQTLEIDAAGPVVSAFCNDLLRACGLPFTVDLVTQQAKVSKGKDGSTQKEVFELKVYDSERGGVARDLADLSGGQQVLVDEALKSAIALLVNQRNVQPIRTCWRDETTGSLDPDTAQRYVEMLRRVHQLGGFHHVLFITHNPEAALQAAAQVVVNDGRAEVRLPPFTAEAA